MTLRNWPELRETSWLRDILEHPDAVVYFRQVFDQAHFRQGDIDYWDYQWSFACWSQNGLSILPNVTLVSNIGFGHPDATHTISSSGPDTALSLEEMKFPLKHPTYVRRIQEADQCIVVDAILSSLDVPRSFLSRFPKPLASFVRERPSLTDPKLFAQKLCQRVLSLFRLSTPS